MKSWIWASLAAAIISSRVASGRPYAMLYSMLSLKSTVSCGTMPIAARTLACAGRPAQGARLARRYRKAHVEEDLPVRLVAEVDVLEADLAGAYVERSRVGRVGDLGMLRGEREHPFHVGERLLHLAVEHAQK